VCREIGENVRIALRRHVHASDLTPHRSGCRVERNPGLARPRQPEEDRWMDEREPDEEASPPKCPECDEPMVYAATGIRHGWHVEWFRQHCEALERRQGAPKHARAP